MKSLLIVLVLLISSAAAVDLISAFHFHTYFFQNSKVKVEEVRELRQLIQNEILHGGMGECALNHLNMEPTGPHPIGSFETCCNASSMHAGLSFFMQNHRKFSVLLHPLTKLQLVDHTERALWIGMPIDLDLDVLPPVLDSVPTCPE